LCTQVALDSGNKLFATSFKLVSAPTDLNLMFDLSLAVNQASVGLLHCNNMNSGSPYTTFADTLRRFRRDYYSGEYALCQQQALFCRLQTDTSVVSAPSLLTGDFLP
jgi:hypothetical protein